MLLVSLMVLAAAVTASAIPVGEDPAVQVFYFGDGAGVMLWTNLTGLNTFNCIQIIFNGPAVVDLNPGKTFVIGGGLLDLNPKNTMKLAANGTVWRIRWLSPFVTGAMVQVYFSGATVSAVYPAVRP
jgi:hypothetical protein